MLQSRTHQIALLLLITIWACIAATFPAFPIDETRYLTVAWEMRNSHNWILPTLNGAPYSHKPPLLFWLINLVWTITGPAVWSARFVSLVMSVCVFLLTGRLAKQLFPDRPFIQQTAPLLTLASPLFMIYGGMIMFDFLLYTAILASLLFLWQAGHQRAWRPWILFGIVMGFGVLAKGPVILVHLLGPSLLAPFVWLPAQSLYTKAAWYGRVLCAILIAACVGLLWAIPAAIIGGHEFAHMIFWGQSADRMVNSFAHRRPVWFYLPFVPVLLLPCLLTAPFWRSLKTVRVWTDTPAIKFILCWILPAFIAFSFISGKQVHYIVPLLSGLALVAAAGLDDAMARRNGKTPFPFFAIVYALAFAVMAAAPFLPFIRNSHGNQVLAHGVTYFDSWIFITGLMATLLVGILSRKRFESQVLAMIFCGGLLLSLTTIEGRFFAYRYYDLSPLARAMQPYGGHPVAYIGKYSGEIGFVARLTQPVQEMDVKDLPQWFEKYPDGIAVMRHESYEILPQFNSEFSMRYRGDQRFTLLTPLK